ncbi:MAG TPA: PD-(D/E)XK nuclease family protein [Candidatus Baltobacteraceae bacterium]|nr:PD-(D/E)XK nuclease family protein [Candidatus Baltobacteraceae bacterium]
MDKHTPEARAFLAGAVDWCRNGGDAQLARLLRSPYSGVEHDAAAAYATLASRNVPLLDAIDRGRLALPAQDRAGLLHFAERMRRLRSQADEMQDDLLRAAVAAEFAVSPALVDPRRSQTSSQPFELADPVVPEDGTSVYARQKHFSASALNAYAECARKWFYRYACGAIEDPGSAASAYGTAFHLALEDFHGEFARPQSGDDAAMRERMREYVRWAFERNRDGFPTQVEFLLAVRRAQRTAQRYVDWLLLQATRAPFSVVGREVPANIELGGKPFVGFIDRLDRDERTGGIGVVDYKTGSIAVTAAEYRDKVRAFRDFQLPFYYWARTAENDRVTYLSLIPLKDARLDVRPIVLEVEPARRSGADAATGSIAVADLERARARMIELADELSSGRVTAFPPTDDPAACTYCAYAPACADKPPDAPERFAR